MNRSASMPMIIDISHELLKIYPSYLAKYNWISVSCSLISFCCLYSQSRFDHLIDPGFQLPHKKSTFFTHSTEDENFVWTILNESTKEIFFCRLCLWVYFAIVRHLLLITLDKETPQVNLLLAGILDYKYPAKIKAQASEMAALATNSMIRRVTTFDATKLNWISTL